MGLFGRSVEAEVTPVATEMDIDWFTRWADDIRARKGNDELRRALGKDNDPDALAALWDRASAIIDHDCRDYVQRYLDGRAMQRYATYFASDELTPWGLISLVSGLNPSAGTKWTQFIIDDMKAKLGRFADIMVDPSIVKGPGHRRSGA